MRAVAKTCLAIACVAATAPRARAQTQVLIVSGLGGESHYSAEFARQATQLAAALRAHYGIADSDVVWLGEAVTAAEPHYGGQSTGANVEREMRRMAARARPGAEFVLVLIGHGSGSEGGTRISLPGPDLTADDFARLLAPFAKQRVAVADLTSASGDALAVLAAKGRVVITATKSAYERNESHFGGFFVDALTGNGADADKDGHVSLLEAFQYAARETARVYHDDNRLQTEHAQLDDDGDGKGSTNPSVRGPEGTLAARFFLDGGATAVRVATNDPRLAALYARRFALTDSVETLKTRKATMPPTAYMSELERLLIDLARTGHAIRALEGAAPQPAGGAHR